MDRVTAKVRSKIMSLVRSRHGRTTESRFRAHLVSRGISGWHMHDRRLAGTPDFIFERSKIVVFVDGCFWHGCVKCQRYSKSRTAFWMDKITTNRRRDIRVAKKLRDAGWKVLRVRECDLKNPQMAKKVIERVIGSL